MKKTLVVGLLIAALAAPVTGSANAASKTNFTKIKIALVPGGAHPYFQPWVTGGKAAASEFKIGGTIFNETGEWDQTKQNAAIDAIAAQGYNAFGLFGVSPTDINTTFKNLKSKGFAVGSLASCPGGYDIVAEPQKNSADFCLSTDTGKAAELAADAVIKQMGGKGNLVHLTGNAVDANTIRRMDGVKKAIAKTGGKVKLLTTITDIDTDLQTATKAVADLMAAKGKQINGIVTTAYNPAVAATQSVAASKLPIKVIAIDDDAKILDAIKSGVISGTVVQNPWGQGYVGSWVLAALGSKACTMKTPGLYVDSGSFLVTKVNIARYDSVRKQTSKAILKDFQTKYMTCK